MQRPRPSLNALRAFEAVARLRSFTAAADELAVTHGAVSRHIRTLEDLLGVLLLERNARGSEPTADGQRLAEGLSTGFGLIQASIEQLQPGPLTLSCSESIMMYWLLPRLSRFQQANADVELQFKMSYGSADFVRENISVAIRLSTFEPPRDVLRSDVATELIGPVCTADYQRNLRLKAPADLKRARLLVSKTRLTAWQDWIASSDCEPMEPRIGNTLEHFYLLIQAARCGLGIASVPRMLVHDDLRSGALVAPFGFVPGPNKLSLWVAPQVARRGDTGRLVNWLTKELRAVEK